MPRAHAASRKCLRSETVRALGYLLVATAAGSARAGGKEKKKKREKEIYQLGKCAPSKVAST